MYFNIRRYNDDFVQMFPASKHLLIYTLQIHVNESQTYISQITSMCGEQCYIKFAQ